MGIKRYSVLVIFILSAIATSQWLHAAKPYDTDQLELEEARLTSSINELKSKTMQWKKQYRSLKNDINDQDNIILDLDLERPWIPSAMLMDIDELASTIDQALTLTWGDRIARGEWDDIPALSEFIRNNRKRLLTDYARRSNAMKKMANVALDKYRDRIVHINEAITNLEKQRKNISMQLKFARRHDAGIGGIRKIVITEYEPNPSNKQVMKNTWNGNFIRVGTENKFTGTWTGTNITGTHKEEGLTITTYIPKKKIVINRPKLGNYTGTYDNGKWKGSADWYGAGWHWEASIHTAE